MFNLKYMILPDYPIENKEQDQLKRFPLASKVANMIAAFSGKESFVIGVEGKWGSGKTSFINLALGQLDKEKVVYFTFNPWNFSDETSLLRDFFIKLSEAVEKITGKNTGKRMKEYAGKLSELDLGISYGGFSFNPLKLLKFWSPDTSLEAIRKELDGALSGIEKKIVVVIDDIDRLDKKETKLILKLVKLTADFPKTIFVLAYDRNRVEDRITEKENGLEGGEYLKKIIQISFSLPEPDGQSLRKILFKNLDETLQEVYGNDVNLEGNDEKRWNELLYAGFASLFKTIRDINRYISSLRLNWSIMGKDDVNVIDFIAIEIIRITAPAFYSAIKLNKTLFTGLHGLYVGFGLSDNEKAREELYKELLKKIPDESLIEPLDKICKVLFPQLDFKSHYTSDWGIEWRNDRRICAENQFDFYFQLAVPEGSISEVEVGNLIKTLNNQKSFSKNVLRLSKEGKLRQLLSKIIDRINKFTSEQLKTMLLSLWCLGGQIDDGDTAMFDFDDIYTQTDRIAYQSLVKVVPKEERYNFIIELIKNTEDVYLPARLADQLQEIIKKQTEPNKDLLSDEEIVKINNFLVERISKLASINKLSKDHQFIYLLFKWNEWGKEEDVKHYIEDLLKDRVGLLDFVSGFVGIVRSTAGDYKRIDKAAMGKLFSLDELDDFVNKITDEDLENMDTKHKEAVELFRNPPKRGW